MKTSYWGIPTVIIGFIVAVWLYMRRPHAAPPVQFQPSPASSGVPAYTPAVQEYNISPPQMGPSPIISLSHANSSPLICPATMFNTGADCISNDYQGYNVPPAGDLSKSPKAGKKKPEGGKCGGECSQCKTTCPDNNAQFTDGQGNGCMVTTKRKQAGNLEKNYPGLWEKFATQLDVSGLDQNGVLDVVIHADLIRDTNTGSGESFRTNRVPPAQPYSWKGALVTAMNTFQTR